MNIRALSIIVVAMCTSLTAWYIHSKSENKDNHNYYEKEHFLVEGLAFSKEDREHPFDRLPLKFRSDVRPNIWNISKSTAGASVRFITNSPSILVKWKVLNNTHMYHMPDTGIKGVDIYYKTNDNWEFLNTALPTGKYSEAILLKKGDGKLREYKIHLPLYDGLMEFKLGVEAGSTFQKPEKIANNPIVFYGTSITQGGCASRPGMAYTNIVSRKLNTECINFGFKANGEMEISVAKIMARIDANIYILDCLPNMSPEMVEERTIPLVKLLKELRPETPIVLIENAMIESSALDKRLKQALIRKNKTLKEQYNELSKQGIQGLYYISQDGLLGYDHDGTVDGIHYNDIGFLRYSDRLIGKFQEFGLINKK